MLFAAGIQDNTENVHRRPRIAISGFVEPKALIPFPHAAYTLRTYEYKSHLRSKPTLSAVYQRPPTNKDTAFLSMAETPAYTFCTTAESVANAIPALSRSRYLVLDCEGKSIGRIDGALSLVCIGTERAEQIFVFDALSLTRDHPVMRPLMQLLSSDRVWKIVWDGRQDFLEMWDTYGIALRGVLDVQLAEVVSRSTMRGEGQKEQLQRLADGYFSRGAVWDHVWQYIDIQLVIGMQKCLDENKLGGGIKKDSEHKWYIYYPYSS